MRPLTNAEIIFGLILLALGFLAILSMLAISYKMVADDAIREERRKARIRARIMAERKYQHMLATTQFRVRQQLRISNESDIRW